MIPFAQLRSFFGVAFQIYTAEIYRIAEQKNLTAGTKGQGGFIKGKIFRETGEFQAEFPDFMEVHRRLNLMITMITPIRNIRMLILLMVCMARRLKFPGAEGSFFRKK